MPPTTSPFFPVPTATPALDAGFSQPILALPNNLFGTRAGQCLANVQNTHHVKGRPVIALATLCAWSGYERGELRLERDTWCPVWFVSDSSMLLVRGHGRWDAVVAPFVLCQQKNNTWDGKTLSFCGEDLHDPMENTDLPKAAARAYKDTLAHEISLWIEAASQAPRGDPLLHPCDRKDDAVPAWYSARPWLQGLPKGLPDALLHAVARQAPGHLRLKPGELTLLGGHVRWDGRVQAARLATTSTSKRVRTIMEPLIRRANACLRADPQAWPLRAQIAPGRSTQQHGAAMLGARLATFDPTHAPSGHMALAAQTILAAA